VFSKSENNENVEKRIPIDKANDSYISIKHQKIDEKTNSLFVTAQVRVGSN